jgi:hypothetical protein
MAQDSLTRSKISTLPGSCPREACQASFQRVSEPVSMYTRLSTPPSILLGDVATQRRDIQSQSLDGKWSGIDRAGFLGSPSLGRNPQRQRLDQLPSPVSPRVLAHHITPLRDTICARGSLCNVQEKGRVRILHGTGGVLSSARHSP